MSPQAAPGAYLRSWVIVAPWNPLGGSPGGGLFARIGTGRQRRAVDASADSVRQLENIWQTISQTLGPYGICCLGLRPGAGGRFHLSEIGEALRLMLTGEFVPVPW